MKERRGEGEGRLERKDGKNKAEKRLEHWGVGTAGLLM